MASIAERRRFGMFAAAPCDGLGLGNVHFYRGEARALVRAIAKWLGFGLAATAPVVSAKLGRLNKWSFAGDVWFVHNLILFDVFFGSCIPA